MARPVIPVRVVWVAGGCYRVRYLPSGKIEVDQRIVPMRSAAYWRPLNPTSKAARIAVERAEPAADD